MTATRSVTVTPAQLRVPHELLRDGAHDQVIADRLGLSHTTVRHYLTELYTATGVHRRPRPRRRRHARPDPRLHRTTGSGMNGTEWTVDRVVKVTDGDTLRVMRSRLVDIDGRHYRIADADLDGIAIRLVWVNTPEKGHHPGWENARADLTEWVGSHSPLRVICYESGGWDRILGDLLDADGNSASQYMMTVKGWPPYVGSKA